MMVRMKKGGGMGQSNINPTTIWTPQQGWFQETGNPASAIDQPAVYVAPAYIPAPACTQANGGAYVSAECVDLALKIQQQNMALANDANRAVFVQNCLNAGNSPAVCGSRTYGQTPVGGYTSDAFVQGKQYTQDAAGNFVGQKPPTVLQTTSIDCQKGWHVNAARNGCDIDAPAVPPKKDAAPPSTTKNYVDQATSFLGESVSLAGSNFPIWGLAAAGVAALFFLKGGR